MVRAGRVTDQPGVTADDLPTILDSLGIPLSRESTLDGIRQLLVLQDQPDWKRPRPIFFASAGQTAAIGVRFK